MKDHYEYLIVTLTREINGYIYIQPTEKVDINEFQEKNLGLINLNPQKPDEYISEQIALKMGVTTEFVTDMFSDQIHPKNGMQDLLLIAAFDFIGNQGWNLTSSVQSEHSTKYIFSRKL